MSAATARRLTNADVAELLEQRTGRRPAMATLRAYRHRGLMPPAGQDGRWSTRDIERWLKQRRSLTALPSTLTQIAAATTNPDGSRTILTADKPPAVHLVRQARTDGVSWSRIAGALDVSTQRAWTVYGPHRRRG